MTQQTNLNEILALAVKAEPKFSINLPYFNDNYFYRNDYQSIHLDHFDVKQAQEIMCDSTIELIDTRIVELNGIKFTVASTFKKPTTATMSLAYKAVKIENFERENRHCDDSSNSTIISCEPSAVIMLDGESVTLNTEIQHYTITEFQRDIGKNNRDASKLINALASEWLNNRQNYQTLQRLFNTSLDRELYNR